MDEEEFEQDMPACVQELFPYHCEETIPFDKDPEFLKVPSSVAKKFREFCETEKWIKLETLLSKYTQSSTPCLKDSAVLQWIEYLRGKTYPARINKGDIKITEKLGDGNFADVYLAEWHVNSQKLLVAYKQLSQESEEFTKEFKRWKKIRPHPNIARLHGAVWEMLPGKRQQQVVGIVAELHAEGSLLENIAKYRMSMGEEAILQLLNGVAHGLKHLHKNGIVHRDLFARNILLDKQMVPIITDFGLARTNPYIWVQSHLPQTGLAPEVYIDKIFTFQSDVYTLGILVWEMTNRGKVIPKHDKLTFKGDIEANRIAIRCCATKPSERPELDEVTKWCSTAINALQLVLTLDVPVDVELLELLNELKITNAEKIARSFSKEKLTVSVLASLSPDDLQKECLILGMPRGDVICLANRLKLNAAERAQERGELLKRLEVVERQRDQVEEELQKMRVENGLLKANVKDKARVSVESLRSKGLDRVWRGKFNVEPRYTPTLQGGFSRSIIYIKAHTKPNSTRMEKQWMGKLGCYDATGDDSWEDTISDPTARVIEGTNFDAVQEKIGADSYYIISLALPTTSSPSPPFLVPKYRLSRVPIINKFTEWDLLAQTMREQMSSETAIASRLIGDVDVLGNGATNVGFVVQRDPTTNLPIAAQAVKIDGYCFSFSNRVNRLYATEYPSFAIKFRRLEDKRDIQIGTVVKELKWSKLTESQRARFLRTLHYGLSALGDESVLHFLLYRDNLFNEREELLKRAVVDRLRRSILHNLDLQRRVYAEDLSEYNAFLG